MPPENQDYDFLEPGVLESLIKDGREPFEFAKNIDENGTQTRFSLPPKGTTPDDTLQGSPISGYDFWDPDGKYRGKSTEHLVSEEIGKKIMARINAIIKSLQS